MMTAEIIDFVEYRRLRELESQLNLQSQLEGLTDASKIELVTLIQQMFLDSDDVLEFSADTENYTPGSFNFTLNLFDDENGNDE